jgi:putative colanic acid biosynthesis UDP-glucose lipid carrier transferase
MLSKRDLRHAASPTPTAGCVTRTVSRAETRSAGACYCSATTPHNERDVRSQGIEAGVELIRLHSNLLVGVGTLVEAIAPPLIAIVTVQALLGAGGLPLDQAAPPVIVLELLSLLLIQGPVDLGLQLGRIRVPVVVRTLARFALAVAVGAAVTWVTRANSTFEDLDVLLERWALATPVPLVLSALFLNEVKRMLVRRGVGVQRAVIVGWTESGAALHRRVAGDPSMRMQIVGVFDDRRAERVAADDLPPPPDGFAGRFSELAAFVRRQQVHLVFVALPVGHIDRLAQLVDELGDTTVSVYYLPNVAVFDLIQSRPVQVGGLPAVALWDTPLRGYHSVIKRMMDFTIAGLAVLALSPVLVGVALAVKLSSPGPVIFRQRRYGIDGREFVVYKFRSMTVTEDGADVKQATKGDTRVTRVGAFIRRLSLDELPQLFNVLDGQMSLVGPRPHAVAHNEEYRKLIRGYMLRHKVLPGITGLAQINGCRGETSTLEDMEARVHYDLSYLRTWSPLLDLKILALTALRLLRDRKAY